MTERRRDTPLSEPDVERIAQRVVALLAEQSEGVVADNSRADPRSRPPTPSERAEEERFRAYARACKSERLKREPLSHAADVISITRRRRRERT